MKKIIKTKLGELTQTHGKNETFEPSTLEQIIGEAGINKYSTMDREVYLYSLNDMNKTDLHRHAVALGTIPIDSRERLTKKLMSEFDIYTSSYKKPKNLQTEPRKVDPKILAIMAEGR